MTIKHPLFLTLICCFGRAHALPQNSQHLRQQTSLLARSSKIPELRKYSILARKTVDRKALSETETSAMSPEAIAHIERACVALQSRRGIAEASIAQSPLPPEQKDSLTVLLQVVAEQTNSRCWSWATHSTRRIVAGKESDLRHLLQNVDLQREVAHEAASRIFNSGRGMLQKSFWKIHRDPALTTPLLTTFTPLATDPLCDLRLAVVAEISKNTWIHNLKLLKTVVPTQTAGLLDFILNTDLRQSRVDVDLVHSLSLQINDLQRTPANREVIDLGLLTLQELEHVSQIQSGLERVNLKETQKRGTTTLRELIAKWHLESAMLQNLNQTTAQNKITEISRDQTTQTIRHLRRRLRNINGGLCDMAKVVWETDKINLKDSRYVDEILRQVRGKTSEGSLRNFQDLLMLDAF